MERLIDADEVYKVLTDYYNKRTGFLSYSWGIDEHTFISIQSEEYTSDGYRIGTKDFKYETG